MIKRSINIILLVFFCINSCKKDTFTDPTDVRFIIDINRNSGAGGKLIFSKGNLVINEFIFESDRVQGDDIYFKNSFSSGIYITFDPDAPVSELNFDIPQGTYTRINITFSTAGDVNDTHIFVEGSYNSGMGISYPIRFEFKAKETFSVLSQSISGGSEIVLNKDIPMTPKIIFDPIYWFQPVSQNLFDNAEIVDIEGVSTILINSTTNTEIFNIIVGRIRGGVKIIF